jgi:hypothetical protein
MSGMIAMSACRITPGRTDYDPHTHMLTRHSTVVFGQPCGPVAAMARRPTKAPRSSPSRFSARLGLRVLRSQVATLQLAVEIEGEMRPLREDDATSDALNAVFGADHGDETWVGFAFDHPGIIVAPATLHSRLTIRLQPPKKMGFQVVPWAFNWGSDFDKHYLLGLSVLKVGDGKVDPHVRVCVDDASLEPAAARGRPARAKRKPSGKRRRPR